MKKVVIIGIIIILVVLISLIFIYQWSSGITNNKNIGTSKGSSKSSQYKGNIVEVEDHFILKDESNNQLKVFVIDK